MTLRFGMLTTFYPPYNFGGDGIGIQRLARALVRRGHDVTVIHDADAYNALAPTPDPVNREPDDGVHTIPLKSGIGAVSPLLTQQVGRPTATRRRLLATMARERFDVLWYHNISLVGGPGLLALGNAVKVYEAHEHWLVCPSHVLWRHGREACPGRQCLRCVLHYRRPPQLWRYTGLLQRQLHHVHAFIAKSEFSRAKHREFGFPRDMDVVPYFLPAPESNESDSSSPHSRPYVLFVGRLERIKGLDDVIPALRARPTADLLIAGTGDHEGVLKELAGDAPNITFLGRVEPGELTRYYRHALALVVPSVCFETFGIIVIESFRQGTPVLARHIGPLPELIEASGGGETFRTADDLVQRLNNWVADPAHREGLAENARQSFHRLWTEDVVVPQYLEVVRRAAQTAGRDHVASILTSEGVT